MRTHPEKHDPSPYESRICRIIQWLPEQCEHDGSIGFILLALSRENAIHDACNLLATLEANTLITINESGELFTGGASAFQREKNHDNHR